MYRKQIHRSLIRKWKKGAPEKYVGYELNRDMAELYDLMKKVSEDGRMMKALQSFYRINKVLGDIIEEPGWKYALKLAEHKLRVPKEYRAPPFCKPFSLDFSLLTQWF